MEISIILLVFARGGGYRANHCPQTEETGEYKLSESTDSQAEITTGARARVGKPEL